MASRQEYERSCEKYLITPAIYRIREVTKVCPGKLTRLFRRELEADVLSRKSTVSIKLRKPAIFEISIESIDLSPATMTLLNNYCGKNARIRLVWKFYNFALSNTPDIKISKPKNVIEFNQHYTIELNAAFVEYAFTESITLQLFAIGSNGTQYIASSKLKLQNMLDYSQGKLHVDLEMTEATDNLNDFKEIVIYAQLSVWYRFSCDGGTLEQLRKQMTKQILQNLQEIQHRDRVKSAITFGNSRNALDRPSDREIKAFKEALDLVLSRNRALRTKQEEVSNELFDRATWLHEESTWRRTLQEYAILRGTDPSIKWRQWRTESTAHVNLRDYTNEVRVYKPEVEITIIDLLLYHGTPLMKNKSVTHLFIELDFLGYSGPSMEYPHKLLKHDRLPIVFNFTKRFSISAVTNWDDCNRLSQMVRNGNNIRFVLVSEPEAKPDKVQTCDPVAFAYVNLFYLVQLEENDVTDKISMWCADAPNLSVGELKIRISGILAMRRAALRILAPPDYRLLS